MSKAVALSLSHRSSDVNIWMRKGRTGNRGTMQTRDGIFKWGRSNLSTKWNGLRQGQKRGIKSECFPLALLAPFSTFFKVTVTQSISWINMQMEAFKKLFKKGSTALRGTLEPQKVAQRRETAKQKADLQYNVASLYSFMDDQSERTDGRAWSEMERELWRKILCSGGQYWRCFRASMEAD